jgi:DNA-binding NarL/FixJ family response regulator
MVSCLSHDGCRVVGESSGLTPAPDGADVLVLEATPGAVAHTIDVGWPAELAIIVTFSMPATNDVRRLAGAGVCAFLDRDQITQDSLTAAVRGALSGMVSVPMAAFSALVGTTDTLVRTRPLMPRERDVLRLLAEGLDTRTISGTLSYSERTVKNIVHDLFVKLDCRTRAQAVGVATRHGLI